LKRRKTFGNIGSLPYGILLGTVILSPWATAGTGAQEGHVISQYEIKAAYLFNFAKFVEWPASVYKNANSPIRIGILGEDPFRDILNPILNGKKVNGRSFEVSRSDNLEDLRSCHILFVSDSEKQRAKELLTFSRNLPVLTVGEMEGFVGSGGIVNFYIDERRVRIEINPEAAAKARLKVNSKLLQIARLVREKEQP
jgi:hypothetical protein